MSSDNAVTKFIHPTKEVLDWVKTKLETEGSWDVENYEKTDYKEMLQYLAGMELPGCVTVYTGSRYPKNEEGRRVGTFSVYIVTKDYSSNETAESSAQDLLDKAVDLLDEETLNHLVCKVVGDVPVDLKANGTCCEKIDFIFIDYRKA